MACSKTSLQYTSGSLITELPAVANGANILHFNFFLILYGISVPLGLNSLVETYDFLHSLVLGQKKTSLFKNYRNQPSYERHLLQAPPDAP